LTNSKKGKEKGTKNRGRWERHGRRKALSVGRGGETKVQKKKQKEVTKLFAARPTRTREGTLGGKRGRRRGSR